MLRVSAMIRYPQRFLQTMAAPQGPMPPSGAARGGAEDNRIAGVSLMTKTFQHINTAPLNGVGGLLDVLG